MAPLEARWEPVRVRRPGTTQAAHASRRRAPLPLEATGGSPGSRAARTRIVRYRSEIVAVADSARVWFTPTIAKLPEDHPRRRFVATLCLVWRELWRSGWENDSDYEVGELFARCVLIPDDDFYGLWTEPDELLAERFNVPLAEIVSKRDDLGLA